MIYSRESLSRQKSATANPASAIADREDEVVITKDTDFIDSHLLFGSPSRLLLVATGNISNYRLLGLFESRHDE